MKEAILYEKKEGGKVKCRLCAQYCAISPGKRGICAVRENRDGTLYSLVYGKVIARHIDPIEKKPLFHFHPESRSYSIATVGCNLRCLHCQNYDISQYPKQHPDIPGEDMTPEQVVREAELAGCKSISYTYTEPTIFFEFAYDTARRARESGLRNIFVTNGYISKKPLELIAPFLDAANIDLKAFTEEFYRDNVHARLSEVLDSIVEHRKQGIWIEITTLIIPGMNDSDEELKAIASYIVTNLGTDTPWHVSQFHPTYKLTDIRSTPVETLRRARDIGKAAGLRYVYEGNVPGKGGENTICPSCSNLLIGRFGFLIDRNRIRNGTCPDCGTAVAGIGM